ncbi:MAG: hypothetical protein HQL94_02625, partial [Magnetococcales bacterium]|nr:hypothetical protein [Magnetococcales bacterium]MBF0440023.1 hypothetical protein [Magnetococcales bacterium]
EEEQTPEPTINSHDARVLVAGMDSVHLALHKRKNAGTVVLDAARLAATLKSTEQIKEILTGIFVIEEEQTPEPTINSHDARVLVAGMDSVHSRLFFSLLEAPQWARTEFNRLCEALGLMPDGAMEMINESAYEKLNESLLDEADDHQLLFNQKLAQEMLV